MKRHGGLWETLTSYAHLHRSAMKAQKHKRSHPEVQAFHFNLEHHLCRLQDELRQGCYQPGDYRIFSIRDPVPRIICAAPFRDRVVHHALVGVLEPIYERQFSAHSYACRVGKGTHAAVERAACLARRFPYVLRCDISKYFAAIDHEILLAMLQRKIKDRAVLDLAASIVGHSPPQEDLHVLLPDDPLFASPHRRGLPLGNQTSQFFGNVYLDVLDRFITQALREAHFIRYVDDFVIFGECKERLAGVRAALNDFLAFIRLRLHPHKSVIQRTADGFPFLGYRVFPDHRRLASRNVRQMRRRLTGMARGLVSGRFSQAKVASRWAGWWGHARFARSFALRARLIEHFWLMRDQAKCRRFT